MVFVGRQPTRDLMGEQPAAADLGGEVGDPVFQRSKGSDRPALLLGC
jgi:hypothetical protein